MIWKKIPGADNYEASETGKVRRVKPPSYGRGPNNTVEHMYLSSWVERNGYERVVLNVGSNLQKKESVHRLVALAFHGVPRCDSHQVNHINGIKTDNRPENLEWVSAKENTSHAIQNLIGGISGEKNPNASLTSEQVIELRRSYPDLSFDQLSKKYGLSKSAVSRIVYGEAYSDVPHAKEKPSDPVRGRKKLTDEDLRYIRDNHNRMSHEKLANMLGVSRRTVSRVLNGLMYRERYEEIVREVVV